MTRDVDWLISLDSFKGTYGIPSRCARAHVPLHAVVGSVALDTDEIEGLGLASLRQASDLTELRSAGRQLAGTACSA